MAQQYNNPSAQTIKKRYAVLLFIKASTAPLVLYVKEPEVLYNELKEAMQSPKVYLIEKDTEGPVKRVCVVSNQISAVAIQEEQYM